MTGQTARADDTVIIDRIATLLGTSGEWSGADCLEAIALLVSIVRPHPGVGTPDEYARAFHAATGRPVDPFWDQRDDD